MRWRARRFLPALCSLLAATPGGAVDVPCDTSQVELRPAGEAIDAVDAFQRDVRHLVTHRLVGVAEDRAARLLHVDEVSLHEAESTGQVRLRKQMGSRFEMSYQGVVGQASEQRLQIDVTLTERIVLRSESHPSGRTASDLVWRWRFR